MNFLLQNPEINCQFSPNITPRDGNCLLHAILDGIISNDGFRHIGLESSTEAWVNLLQKLQVFDNSFTDKKYVQFLRNRWVTGASEWLAGEHGSKQNDKILLGYSDQEWNYIWSTMMKDGAWAVPTIKDDNGVVVKENNAPELFIKYIAHDLSLTIMFCLILHSFSIQQAPISNLSFQLIMNILFIMQKNYIANISMI